MKIEIEKREKVLIVKLLEPRLDATLVGHFKRKMFELIDGGSNLIVLDLFDVKFIDSSGLGAIVYIHKSLDMDSKIVLCEIDKAIRPIFKLTKLDQFLSMFSTRDEAVAALS